MSTADITQLRRELEQIADDAGKPNYRGDAEHFTSLWANVGRHVPILLDEIEQLRTADVQRRAERAGHRLVPAALSSPVPRSICVPTSRT